MASNYPGAIDNSTTLPLGVIGNPLNNPSLTQIENNQTGGIIAVQTKLGIGGSTPDTNQLLMGTGSGASAWSKSAPNGTIVGTSDSQTLTNKNIISPTITNATITGATITGANVSLNSPLSIAQGGTGTSAPSLTPGSNISISGTWPNQTISSNMNNISTPGSTVNGNIVAWNNTTGTSLRDTGIAQSSIVTLTGSQTLTNKTLTAPVINNPVLALSNPLSVANGGTGTSTPGLIAGANVSITGTWPNQTITSIGGGGGGGGGGIDGPATTVSGFIPQWGDDQGKTLSGGVAAPAGAIVGTSDTQTLTNKTITGATITGSNITGGSVSELTAPIATADGGTGTASPSLVAGAGISISGMWPNNTIASTVNNISTPTTTAVNNIALFGNTTGKSLIDSGTTLASLATLTGTQTLTNKTLTNPSITGGTIVSGTISSLTAPLAIASGGTGTTSPSLVGGSSIAISGTWPNQTVTFTGTSTPSAVIAVPTDATSTSTAYTVTNSSIPSTIPNGYTFVIIPSITSTSTTATLSVNGSTPVQFQRNLSDGSSLVNQSSAGFLRSGVARMIAFNGTTWTTVAYSKPLLSDANGVLPTANGGTGTSSPTGISAGQGITVSGTWPNQTINATATSITTPSTTVIGDLVAWNNTTGTNISDASIPVSNNSGTYQIPSQNVSFTTSIVPQHGQGGDGWLTIIPNYSGLLVWDVQGRINMGSGTDLDISPAIQGTYSGSNLNGTHVYGTNQTNWSVNGQALVTKGKQVQISNTRSNGASMTSIVQTWRIIPNVVGA